MYDGGGGPLNSGSSSSSADTKRARDEEHSPEPGSSDQESASESISSESEGDNKRRDLPRLRGKRGRGAKKKALSILRNPAKKQRALAELRRDFHAASGAASLTSQRRTVEGLIKEALHLPKDTDSDLLYPVTVIVVSEVAAALKAGGYRAADQYLGEMRIAHIESGAEIPLVLTRTFSKCRRSITRGIGPPHRAAELRLSDTLIIIIIPSDEGGEEELKNPTLSYVVAEGWLLREIEVANSEVGHVRAERDPVQDNQGGRRRETSGGEKEPWLFDPLGILGGRARVGRGRIPTRSSRA